MKEIKTDNSDLRLYENVRLSENLMLEIGLNHYLPFSIDRKSAKNFQAKFAIDAKDIEVQDADGATWHNLGDRGVTSILYTVTIKLNKVGRAIPIERDGISDQIKVKTSTVMFSNDNTSMGNLKGNIGIVVFSTIAKILSAYSSMFQSEFQCFEFTPAQPKLIPVYEILSKESEKQSNLIYANKDTGRSITHWYLLSKNLWQKYKDIKGVN